MSGEPLTRAELRAVAEAATPGPWRLVGAFDAGGLAIESPDSAVTYGRGAFIPPFPSDAAHIAAFDPPTVLAVLDDLQAAERRAEIAEKALGRVAAIRSNSPDLHSDAVCDIAIFVASEALDDLRALLKSAPE